jgi:hypothetical protein
MRIGRALIIPAILTLGVTGSILASSAVPLAAAHTSTTHVVTVAAGPDTMIYG